MINVEDCKEVFEGNDSATSFPFDFKVNAATDLEVGVSINGGEPTTLTLNAHYSVTLNENQNTNPGGTITYPLSGDPLADGDKLYVLRSIAATQPMPFTGGVTPAALEAGFDNLTMQVQKLIELTSRCIKGSVLDSADMAALPLDRVGKYLTFNAEGNPIVSEGTGADAGLRADLASFAVDMGASLVARSMRYTRAVGDGTDEWDIIQGELNDLRDYGICPIFEGGKTYRCDQPLTLLRNTTDGPEHYYIQTNGAIFDLSNVTTGSLFKIGATSQNNGHDTGFIIVAGGLNVIGPEDTAVNFYAGDEPDTDSIGIDLEFAFNIMLDNPHPRRCYIGMRTKDTYPGLMLRFEASNCGICRYIRQNSTLCTWVAPTMKSARYGSVTRPDATTGLVSAQRSDNPRYENVQVGDVVDPRSGSGVGVAGYALLGSYFESITYDPLRIGVWTWANPDTPGGDTNRDVYGYEHKPAQWSMGAYTSTHKPIRIPTNGTVRGGDIVIPGALAECIGNFDNSHLRTTTDSYIGASSEYVNRDHAVQLTPKQPAFSAYSSSVLNVTGDGTTYTVIQDNEDFDIRSDHSPSTGKYTARYTGIHALDAAVGLDGITSSHDRGNIDLVIEGTSAKTLTRWFNPVSGNNKFSAAISAKVFMTAGDTAKINITVSGSTKVVDILSTESYFTGVFLG